MPRSLTFDSLQIQKLFRQNSISTAVYATKFCSAVLIALLCILLIHHAVSTYFDSNSIISKLNEDVKKLAEIQPVKIDQSAVKTDLKVITNNKLFGELGAKVIPQTVATPKPATPLNLQLIGTYVATGESPYCIIEDKKKKEQDVFVVGDVIFGEAKLISISSDRVEVDRGGQKETLKLDETPDETVEMKDGVAVIGDNQFVVDEAEIDKTIQNLATILTQARAVPYFKEGKAVGLRMFAIKTGSIFEKIGLKNGDILKSINGNSMGDLSQAMKLFERLKEERSLTVSLERNNEEKEFRYQIR
jgi:general secretion pathway protein C